MPDESCRHCGGKLLDFSQCAECKQITRMMCQSCGEITMEQFHSQCLIDIFNPQISQAEIIGSFYTVA